MEFDSSGRRKDGRELTYSEYINVPSLLRGVRLPEELPRGRREDEWPARPNTEGETRKWQEGDPWPESWPHDEHLFIVTHQTFELWFRQALLEIDDVMRDVARVLAKHGAALPTVDLSQRELENATPLRRVLNQYPRTASVIERSLAPVEWEKRWAQELHEPGSFPTQGDPLPGAIELAWFDASSLTRYARRIDRVRHIFAHATGAFGILETMPPEEFLAFRGRLDPASGFGSTQFRELEIMLGLKDMQRARLRNSGGDLSFARHMPPDENARMHARMNAPSLRDLVYALLNARDVAGDPSTARRNADEVMSDNLLVLHDEFERSSQHASADRENFLAARWRGVDEILAHAENIRLVVGYTRGDLPPALRAFLEKCLELDGALRAWRQTHIPMVERIIGARPGTGGGGLAYLQTTLRAARGFPCLWEFRSILTAPR